MSVAALSAVTGPISVLDITPASYTAHPLHAGERIWDEVNCYVDLWIEVLSALGCDPIPMLAFVFSAGFDDDQWTFVKPAPEDLRALYGLDVYEMNPWRLGPAGILEHVQEQLRLGRLVTLEADAFYLPDTAGVSYQREHVKTTIVPQFLDREGQQLGYFHGAGYYLATGADFTGALRLAEPPGAMAPYVELVRLDRLTQRPVDSLAPIAVDLARTHLLRRPPGNPVTDFGVRMQADVLAMTSAGTADMDLFHAYAFATCRQCGATAELAADLVGWLARNGAGLGQLESAVEPFLDVAQTAKALQFSLARAMRGRRVDLDTTLGRMAQSWETAMGIVTQSLV